MRRILFVVLVATLLGGCKWIGSRSKSENVDPPAELVDLAASVPVDSLWSASTGDGEGRLLLRQRPALADGRVYTADPAGDVRAFDAASGRVLWRLDTGLRLSGGPGHGEDTLVIGSLDGEVLAINPDSGSERWRARVSSEVVSAPAVGQGVAVVRSLDGRVFGFSITDGSRRWVYDRGLPSLTLRGSSAPVIQGRNVYVGYDSGEVVALALADGSQQWEQRVAEAEGRSELDRMVDIDGELVVTPGELYAVSYKGEIMAMDPASGRPLWTRDVASFTGLSLDGDRLLLSDVRGTVWALDRRSGAAMWRQDGLAHRWLTTPAVHGDYAVVGDFDGYLHWLRLDNGELAARTRLGRKAIRATPQVADGVLHAVTSDGKLAAFRLY